MRQMEFKVERTGLINVGDVLKVTEGKLPNSYYYTIEHAYGMSANFPNAERLKTFEGTVVDYREPPKGFYATLEFEE